MEAQLDWAQQPWFGWVFTDHPPSAHALRRRLEAWLEAHEQRLVVLKPESPRDADGLLAALLGTESEGVGCVWVEMLRWDLALPGAEPDAWREAWTQLMLRGNERREALLRHLGGGLVFVAPMERKEIVRDAAPDLWSMRSLVVEVRGEVEGGGAGVDLSFLEAQPIEVSENHGLELEVARQQAEIARERGDVEGELRALAREADLLHAAGAVSEHVIVGRRLRWLASQLNEPNVELSVRLLLPLGHGLLMLGKFEEALEVADDALVLCEQLEDQTSRQSYGIWAAVLEMRSKILTKLNRHEEALSEARRAVDKHRDLATLSTDVAESSFAEALRLLGTRLLMSGDLPGAIAAMEESFAYLLDSSLGSSSHLRQLAASSMSLADVRKMNGDIEAALQTLDVGLARTEALSEMGWYERVVRSSVIGARATLLERLGRRHEAMMSARLAMDLIWEDFVQSHELNRAWMQFVILEAASLFSRASPPQWLLGRDAVFRQLTGSDRGLLSPPPPTEP